MQQPTCPPLQSWSSSFWCLTRNSERASSGLRQQVMCPPPLEALLRAKGVGRMEVEGGWSRGEEKRMEKVKEKRKEAWGGGAALLNCFLRLLLSFSTAHGACLQNHLLCSPLPFPISPPKPALPGTRFPHPLELCPQAFLQVGLATRATCQSVPPHPGPILLL